MVSWFMAWGHLIFLVFVLLISFLCLHVACHEAHLYACLYILLKICYGSKTTPFRVFFLQLFFFQLMLVLFYLFILFYYYYYYYYYY